MWHCLQCLIWFWYNINDVEDEAFDKEADDDGVKIYHHNSDDFDDKLSDSGYNEGADVENDTNHDSISVYVSYSFE